MYGEAGLEAELRATAIDFRTLLRRTSLVVGREGALAPLEEHSTGLQTLALFGLFRAYLETAGGHLLAAGLEEPEIHLAPHVSRSLVRLATEPGNQVVFTSHSPAITDAFPVTDVRVLSREANGTSARAIPDELFDHEELARLHRELRSVGTEFLFARSVLLCEGASEKGALPEFGKKLGLDLDLLGVSLLPVGGGGFHPYLKLLGPDGFAIPHAVVCDNDQTLRGLIKMLDELDRLPEGVNANDDPRETELQILRESGNFAWSSGDLEGYLVDSGGYSHFEEAASFLYGPDNLARFRSRKAKEGVDDDTEIIRRYTKLRRVRKPELAAECAVRFREVPEEISTVLRHAVDLARSAERRATVELGGD